MADVLVTGAAGFVGEALLRRLASQGIDAVGTDLRAGFFPTIRMDITQADEVRGVFARVRPRLVVHAAAVVDDRVPAALHHRVNVEGTRHILEAADGIRLVQISSIAAFGVDPGPVVNDSTPLATSGDDGRPYFSAGAYFVTKALSDQLVRRRRPDAIIVRPGDVYGPGSQPWVERPLQMMRARQPVLIDGGRGMISACFIDDLIDGILLAMEAPDGSCLTFHAGEATSYRTYFEALARAFGVVMPTLSVPRNLALLTSRALERGSAVLGSPLLTESAVRYVCRCTQYSLDAARALGWAPQVSLSEGMKRLAAG